MAKYRFHCAACEVSVVKYANSDVKTADCKGCSGTMTRLISMPSQSNVTELIDSYSGIHLSPDHKQQILDRSSDHYWAVEVPRLCSEYSESECLHQGWAYLDESGNYRVYTKSPSKR